MKRKKNELELKPTYWASVSGGKDSLFMLKLILSNLDKYPLHGVVYFDLEIDYPFIKDVISKIREECVRLQIPLFCIKPSVLWTELYDRYKFPNSRVRWCNFNYKLSCKREFAKMQARYGNSVKWYIGFCADEKDRLANSTPDSIFPLAEQGIEEQYILEWAKKQSIYNDYYKVCKRCGCTMCPLSSLIEKAYLYKYYPQIYNQMIYYMIDTEITLECKKGKIHSCYHGNYDTSYLDHIIKTKWIYILENELEKYNQLSLFD